MLEHAMTNFALLGAWWVLWVLVAMSVVVVFVSAERWWFLRANSTPLGPYEATVSDYLRGGSREKLTASLASLKGLEARVLAAGLGADSVDAAAEAMGGTLAFERIRMERGLLVIGTVASNAPYVGLFGTVLGIIKAFHDLAESSAESANAVMAGISEALVSTAVGLMVAIPAVILFNVFTRRVKSQVGRLESVAQLILSRLRASQAA